MNKTPVLSWGHITSSELLKKTRSGCITKMLRGTSPWQPWLLKPKCEISQSITRQMLLPKNAGLQYSDSEINFLNFVIISGEISAATMVIIDGIKNK